MRYDVHGQFEDHQVITKTESVEEAKKEALSLMENWAKSVVVVEMKVLECNYMWAGSSGLEVTGKGIETPTRVVFTACLQDTGYDIPTDYLLKWES